MKKQILRLLNIQESESSKIFYFFLFSIFIQAGVAMGESIANSMFLVNIGIQQLSIIYMMTPFIILFIYIPIYSFFKSRYGEKAFFTYSLLMLIIINTSIYFFLENAKSIVPKEYFDYIYYFILLYTTIMVITLYTLVWNFIDSFFDIMDSKRVFSIFSAGTAIGAILGGAVVSSISNYFSANILLICWSVSSLIAFLFLIKISHKFKSINEEEDDEELPILKQLMIMFKNIKSSMYVMILLFVFFISVLLATILEYEYLEILSKDQSVESLALLFGQLYIVVNIFNLIINVFLFNRLVIRFGVRNVLLIQPVAYLLVFSYLSIYVGIEAGIFGFFVVQGLLVSIDYNNQNLLYNGINSKIKYEVRTFIENLGEPFAIAVAGLILFLVGSTFSISQVAYIGLAIALLYLILAIILKYNYPIAMIKNLKNNWLDLTYNEIKIIENIPLVERKKVLDYQKDTNTTIAVRVIRSYDEPKAIETLLDYLNKADKIAYYKSELLLHEILDSNNPKVIQAVIDWSDNNLKRLNILLKKELGSRGLISSEELLPNLLGTDIQEVSAASVTMLNSQYPHYLFQAIDRVDKLLKSSNQDDIIEGLYILGKSKHKHYAFYVTKFLNNKNDIIVTQALDTIYKLSDNNLNNLTTPILEIFTNGSKEQRLLSIKILAKIKDTSSIVLLLDRIEIVSIYEKYEILDMISSMGLQSIPALVTTLVEENSYFSRSIAGRSLGNLAFAQFKDLEEDLILKEIETVYKLLSFYKTILLHQEDTHSDSLFLLSKYFMDKHQVILEFILEILSIGGNLPSVELMKTSIRSSNPKVRGNAIETIEQSTKQSIFKMLLPLLDGRDIDEVIYFYNNNYNVLEYDINNILEYSLSSNSEIEILLAISYMPSINPSYLKSFRKKLLSTNNSIVRDALFAQINSEESFDIIYKLSKVSQYNNMSYFNIFVLYIMLKNSDIKIYHINNKAESIISGISILVSGECSIDDKIYHVGDFIGFDNIFSKELQNIKVVKHTEDIEVLIIQKSSLIDAIEIYPEIGIGFLK